MIYLLDTHVFLWTIIDVTKLSKKAYTIIENNENKILVSSVSLWEVSVKYSLGKLSLIGLEPNDLLKQGKGLGFEFIPITTDETASYHQLNANWHKDPFDRMLIWQAIQKNITLISKDEDIKKYRSAGLKTIW